MRIPGDVVRYRGRFAPSPTGALHAGSLVAALASWLDARAHGGAWLVRIEDIDGERCLPGMGDTILAQLAACGLVPDEAPVFQSTRLPRYRDALSQLGDRVYGCACSRRLIQAHWQQQGPQHGQQHGQAFWRQPGASAAMADAPYPGTCRAGIPSGATARSLRLRLPPETLVNWCDRRLGEQSQDVAQAVGDFALARCNHRGEFMQATYQLAVVVDDADQGITDIVRGEDLADNTPRQRRSHSPTHLSKADGMDNTEAGRRPNTWAACDSACSACGAVCVSSASAPVCLDSFCPSAASTSGVCR